MLRPGDWCASGPSTPLSPHYNSTSVGDRKHVLLNKYALRLCPSAPHHSKLVTLGGRWQLAGPGPELLRCGCGTRCLLGSLLLRVCDAWVTWRCRWMELEPERHGAPTTRPHGAAMHLSYVHRVRNVQVRACSRHSRQAPRPGHRCIHVASSHHGSTAAEHSCTGRERKRGTGRLYAAAALRCAVPLLWPSHAAVAAFDAIHPSIQHNRGNSVSGAARAPAFVVVVVQLQCRHHPPPLSIAKHARSFPRLLVGRHGAPPHPSSAQQAQEKPSGRTGRATS